MPTPHWRALPGRRPLPGAIHNCFKMRTNELDGSPLLAYCFPFFARTCLPETRSFVSGCRADAAFRPNRESWGSEFSVPEKFIGKCEKRFGMRT
jgi:hypothetical protein